jgi:hypothetical protein
MKYFRRLLFLTLFAATTCVLQQPIAFAGYPQAGLVDPASQSPAVHILAPTSGETLAADFVNVQYELVHPALSDEPTFLIQLDTADPVHTSETSHTFSDLQPGVHTVRVTLVDANNSPVQGGAATVQFKLTATQPPVRDGSRGSIESTSEAIAALTPSVPVPPELASGELNLPLRGSPLPILSLIGFGLLISGAARAMRAR